MGVEVIWEDLVVVLEDLVVVLEDSTEALEVIAATVVAMLCVHNAAVDKDVVDEDQVVVAVVADKTNSTLYI